MARAEHRRQLEGVPLGGLPTGTEWRTVPCVAGDNDPDAGNDIFPPWALEAKAALNVAAAFVPPLTVVPAFLDYLEGWRDRQARRMGQMSAAATDSYPGSAEELLDRLQTDPQRLAMLDSALAAAARSSTEAKARALGRALASGALASDDAQVDEAAQRLRIIGDLEAVDVKVLDLLAKVTYHRTVEIPDLQERPLPVPRSASAYVTISQLEPVSSMTLEAAQASIAVLQRDGLVNFIVNIGTASAWYITELGIALLEDFAGDAKLAKPERETSD